MKAKDQNRIVTMVRRNGFVRPREIEHAGIPRWEIYAMAKAGVVTRHSRGLYTLPDAPITENHSYAEAAKIIPRGIICLISALRFHRLTTQNPTDVWVAIPRGTWQPKSDALSLRIVQFSGDALTSGIEGHEIEGVKVRVTNAPRTIVDCFRFRNHIGTDVALEALRDGWRKRQITMRALVQCAKVFRMQRVIMPYLESLS